MNTDFNQDPRSWVSKFSAEPTRAILVILLAVTTLFGAGSCCSTPEPMPSKAEKEPWELLPLDSTEVDVKKLMGEPIGASTLRLKYSTGYKGLSNSELDILRRNMITRTLVYESGVVVHFNMLGKVHSIEQADPDDIDSWEGKTLRMFAGVRE